MQSFWNHSLIMSSENLQKQNREKLLSSKGSVIVLDDDPTGTQTVHDLPVLTSWRNGEIQNELKNETPVFYVLTNTRATDASGAARINHEILSAIENISDHWIISRSDSTLRGHYPLETDIIQSYFDEPPPILIIPFFEEGGRLTKNDVHYVKEGDSLIPAAETPFAKDTVFGFSNSNLKDWVEEKTQGKIPKDKVQSISPNEVEQTISQLENVDQVGIVNATSMKDMEILVAALHNCKKKFLFRTAGSFVRALAGLPKKPLLQKEEVLGHKNHGGIIVVGSYVPKSTQQLKYLLSQTNGDLVSIELDVQNLDWSGHLPKINQSLKNGLHVVVYTTRDFQKHENPKDSLEFGKTVSNSLVQLVKSIQVEPQFIIAKGGITSSDIATKALNIKRGMVVGQLIPGVPVWRSENNQSYIVFPGNVGDEKALFTALERLSK